MIDDKNKKYKNDGQLPPYASRKSIDESNHLVATRNLKSLPRTCSLECSNTTIKQHTKQNINDNSQKADDVRQSRTQVSHKRNIFYDNSNKFLSPVILLFLYIKIILGNQDAYLRDCPLSPLLGSKIHPRDIDEDRRIQVYGM